MVEYGLNEVYLGTVSDIANIKSYLSDIRKRTEINQSVSNLIEQDQVEPLLLEKLQSVFFEFFDKPLTGFNLLDWERYNVFYPENIGGFYGYPVGGYFHIKHMGNTTLLNSGVVKSKSLRTLELFRAYLHDSFHANTYKTYKWNATNNSAYRYQYGINFRDANGVSYSSATLSNKSPLGINLNILMDGIIHYYVSSYLRFFTHNFYTVRVNNETEHGIYHELLFNFVSNKYTEPMEFYKMVMLPTKKFLAYWGEDFLMKEILNAMITGNINELYSYFSLRLGVENAWEIMFKQDKYNVEK